MRKWAIIIWILGILIFELMFVKNRVALYYNIKAFIIEIYKFIVHPPKAFRLFEIMEVLLLILVFWISWNLSLYYKIKWDYLLSIFTVLIPLLDKHYYVRYLSIFKKSFKRIFLLSSVTTFLINQYTFSLWVELLLVFLIMLLNMLIVTTKTFYKINNKNQIMLICNTILSIVFVLLIFVSIYHLITNINETKVKEYIIEYFMSIGVLLINLPVIWRYINMIDRQMQKFQHNSTFDYVKYLFIKMVMRIKIDLLAKIIWNDIFIETDALMCYKMILTKKVSYRELIQIIKALESMAVPRNVYKEPQYKRIPIRIDMYYVHNKISHIATWIEPWIKNNERYSYLDDDLKYVHDGLYVNLKNI